MNPLRRLLPAHTRLSEEQADRLVHPPHEGSVVAVRPPRGSDLPPTLDSFVRGILEYQTKWLGLRNASPSTAFELLRDGDGQLRLQYWVPSSRLERKLRTHLTTDVPGVEFVDAAGGLPVEPDESVGGALLTVGDIDWYPLRTEYQAPPTNGVVAALHPDAMADAKFHVQVLFQPVAGKPLRRRYWRRRAYQQISHLRRERHTLWGRRNPTPRERQQADAIEEKAGSPRFHVAIRFVVIGAGELTRSHVKELAGGFNGFESLDTGQHLNTVTVASPLRSRIYRFCRAVATREFRGWSRRFQVSIPELAALVSLPDRQQSNIRYAQP